MLQNICYWFYQGTCLGPDSSNTFCSPPRRVARPRPPAFSPDCALLLPQKQCGEAAERPQNPHPPSSRMARSLQERCGTWVGWRRPDLRSAAGPAHPSTLQPNEIKSHRYRWLRCRNCGPVVLHLQYCLTPYCAVLFILCGVACIFVVRWLLKRVSMQQLCNFLPIL